MATEAEIIASNILASAIEYKRLYDTTKKNEYKVKEQRLRRIAENIKLLVAPGSTSSVSSFNGRTGAVMLTSADVTGALGYTPPTTLDGLNDVTISAPANAQVLTYNSTTGQWENQTPAGGGGGGDMDKSTYDVDNDGVVDSAERTEIIVRNSTGSTLTKGQVVYLSGATGNRPNAVLSKADTEATSSKTIGIVVANIANNSDGYVATNGTLHDLDTSAFADGDAVWLSATTAGAFTSTVPAEPNHAVFVGYIARAHPTAGRIVLHFQNGYEFDELHGVLLSSPANNDLVVYESSTSLWKNKSISTIFGGTPLVSVPTLAQVTTAGNTTTNPITVGGLTISDGFASITKTTSGATLTLTPSASDNAIVINSSGFIKFAAAAVSFIRGFSGATLFAVYNSSYTNIFNLGTSAACYVNTGTNFLIGTTTDAGYKLDVNGTARVQGNLTMPNFTNIVSQNNQISFETFRTIHYASAGTLNNQYGFTFDDGGGSSTLTTGVTGRMSLASRFAPTSGTAQYTTFVISPTVNQTGGANGITRGLYVNPTITAAADFRAIEAVGRIMSVYDAPYDTTASNSNFVLQHSNGSQAGISITSDGAMRVKAPAGSPFVIITGSVQTWFNRYGHSSIQAFSGDFGIYGGSDVQKFRIFNSTGNVLIQNGGTFTDAGYRLDVNGSTRIKGAGTTSATTAFLVQNSTPANIFSVLDDSSAVFDLITSTSLVTIRRAGAPTSRKIELMANGGARFYTFDGEAAPNANGDDGAWLFKGRHRRAANSGIASAFRIEPFFVQEQFDTIQLNSIHIVPTINVSGTATNVTVRGIYYNPTVASLVGVVAHRAIETTSGDVIFNGGNVGIGVTPVYKLDVNGVVRFQSTGTSSVTHSFLFRNDNSSYGGFTIGSSGQALSIQQASGYGYLTAAGFFIGSTNSNIWTNNGSILDIQNAAGTTTYLRVASTTGNLLIGTTTDAGYKLDVNGSARVSSLGVNGFDAVYNQKLYVNGNIRIQDGNGIGNTNTSTSEWIKFSSVNGLVFGTNSTERLRIDTTGNVGIGTTAPTDIFHIVNNTNGNKFGRISAGGSDASAAWVAQNDQVDNVVYRVFGSGVSGTQMGIALARSASLLANLGGSGKFLLGTFSNTDFVMGTGNAEKMRIVDSTGNILIATTTDLGNKLEVNGTINATAYKINNVLGYTGILNIPLNPPGMQNVDIQSGIIVNIF